MPRPAAHPSDTILKRVCARSAEIKIKCVGHLGVIDTWLLPLRQLRKKYKESWDKERLSDDERKVRLVEENVRQGVQTVREHYDVVSFSFLPRPSSLSCLPYPYNSTIPSTTRTTDRVRALQYATQQQPYPDFLSSLTTASHHPLFFLFFSLPSLPTKPHPPNIPTARAQNRNKCHAISEVG